MQLLVTTALGKTALGKTALGKTNQGRYRRQPHLGNRQYNLFSPELLERQLLERQLLERQPTVGQTAQHGGLSREYDLEVWILLQLDDALFLLEALQEPCLVHDENAEYHELLHTLV